MKRMRLATWISGGKPAFGLIGEDGGLYDASVRGEIADLRHLILATAADAARLASGNPDTDLHAVTLTPPIAPGAKVICVGVNYPERNAEYKDGTAQPKYPSLFPRFPASFAGHGTPILRPPESEQFDYEGEIVLVIGKGGRRIPETKAHEHVFGVTLMNEGSVRDWLRHGKFNVTQGKNFDRSGSIGPWIVPVTNGIALDDLTVTTRVNGEERQRGNTCTLLYSIPYLISYISTFTSLEPGDLIATGTPPGAGGRFDPPKWLKAGDLVEVYCSDIGLLSNTVEDEAV
jgi:2-keto-4-pentenoate hydratase/2-oxohepta-3-ene-1,7-dioic acid hydratase in catechol pathway